MTERTNHDNGGGHSLSRYIVGQTYTIDGGQMSNLYETGSFKERRSERFGKGYVEGI